MGGTQTVPRLGYVIPLVTAMGIALVMSRSVCEEVGVRGKRTWEGVGISQWSHGVGRILFQYLAHPSGGDSDLRNWVSITKLLFYHSFHFYPPKEAPIPFENITIGFSSSSQF